MSGECRQAELVQQAAETVLSIAPTLPLQAEVEQALKIVEPATQRGYLLPDEDDFVRELFSRYLTARAILLEAIWDLRNLAYQETRKPQPDHPELFLIPFAAATLLMRAGRYMVDEFVEVDVIREKLNEAEPRWGIPRKQFTTVYKSVTDPRNVWTYLEAVRYWRQHKNAFCDLCRSPDGSVEGLIALLISEEAWMQTSRSYYVNSRLKYRLHSLWRRQQSGFGKVTFSLFKASGRVIAEVRNQWRRKRVTPGVQRKLSRLLQAGDVIISRHDDAATNWFLPGFWPHASLYIGTAEQRRALQVEMNEARMAASGDPICVLEARKDGVLFRQLSDTLSVDACTVIRPRLPPQEIARALSKAITHEGKPYDFEFDFRRSDKLVCTEVVYRAFHGAGPIHFQLSPRAGRLCLSAEDLLDAAIDRDLFEVVAIFGFKGNRFAVGERARELLIESYRHDRPVARTVAPLTEDSSASGSQIPDQG